MNDKKGKNRIIFYFTATGNCLYVARQLSDNTISIPQAFKSGELSYEADEIGIVCPTYRGDPPEMVKKFLAEATLKAGYLFAVMTFGVAHTSIVREFQKYAKEGGKKFDYIATMTMVDNYLPGFDMNSETAKKRDVEGRLAKIKSDIDGHKKKIERVSILDRVLYSYAVKKLGDIAPTRAEKVFTISDACISCGTCVRVCPRGNYSIVDGKATCKGECEFCLSCIQNCPKKAITLTAGEKNSNARYRNPNVKLIDIIRANNQG